MGDNGLKAAFLQERPMLLRLLVARLRYREEAEDALQDMWLKLDSLEPRPVAQPAAYLYRMASNLATDRRVSALRGGRRDTAWLDVQVGAQEVPGAERVLIGRDALRRVESHIATMPEKMRQALRMFRIEELPQRDIAVALGITVSGVEKLLKRAYREIHDSFGPFGDEQDLPRRHTRWEDIDRDE
jgi:RNA polymerase sigma factor (sigma-70 family)